jgi:TonB family protein
MLGLGCSLLVGIFLRVFLSIHACAPSPTAVQDLASQTAVAATLNNGRRIRTVILPGCSLAASICAEFDTTLRAKLEKTIPGVQFVGRDDPVGADILVNEGLSLTDGLELQSEIVDNKLASTTLGKTINKFHGCVASHPACLYCPQTIYASDVKDKKMEGTTVSLLVTIKTDGRAGDVTVVKSLCKELDQRAIEMVQGWRFRPAMTNLGTEAGYPAVLKPISTRLPVVITIRIPYEVTILFPMSFLFAP